MRCFDMVGVINLNWGVVMMETMEDLNHTRELLLCKHMGDLDSTRSEHDITKKALQCKINYGSSSIWMESDSPELMGTFAL